MRMITFYECPIRTKCKGEESLPLYGDSHSRSLYHYFHCDYGRKTCLIKIDLDKVDDPTLLEILDRKWGMDSYSPEELNDIYKYGRFDLIMKELERRKSCSECVHKGICKYQDKYNEFIDKLQVASVEERDIFDVMPICNKFTPGEVYR